jgi:large subunit ribosomal protein L32
MGPLPKRKLSKGRRDRRRAHDAIGAPTLGECTNCHQPVLPHRACSHCGYYRGRQVLKVSVEKPSAKK